jgi:hypothetical protein
MLSIRYKPSMPVSFEVGVIVLTAPQGDFIPSLSSITSVSMSIVSSEKAVCAFDSDI